MDTNNTPSPAPQAAEGNGKRVRKLGARLSPRKLSALTRSLILDEFMASGDIDAVAKAYRVPVRTVDSVLHWHSLRKPITPETRPFAVRRLA